MSQNNNGNKLDMPDHLHFKRSPLKCKRCQREYKNLIMEEIDDKVQLRCGDVIFPRAEIVCLHCGSVIYWHFREEDIEKMAVAYAELSRKLDGYASE